MKIFSILFVTTGHLLLFIALIGIEETLWMRDFSSEGLTEQKVSSTQPSLTHQKDAWVIAVIDSDWIFPHPPSDKPMPHPIPRESSHPVVKISPKNTTKPLPPPAKKVTQKISPSQNRQGTGSGNRQTIGKGSGTNINDGPAGFVNGNSDQTILSNIQRCYPLISRKRGEQGLAIVRIYVDENGNATNIEIIQSSKFSRLDKCALKSVEGLKVKPQILNGKKTPSHFDKSIRFHLN